METTSGQAGRAKRRELWRAHVRRQAESGQSAKDYCHEHGLKPWQWYYWHKVLQQEEAGSSGFVELRPSGDCGVVIECEDCRIVVRQGFDPGVLRAVVGALRLP